MTRPTIPPTRRVRVLLDQLRTTSNGFGLGKDKASVGRPVHAADAAANVVTVAGTAATPSPPSIPKLLVIHGKGCEERGKTPALIKSHGPLTMEDYTDHIIEWAAQHAVEVRVFHSTLATEVCAELLAALDSGVTGVSITLGRGLEVGTAPLHSLTPSTRWWRQEYP